MIKIEWTENKSSNWKVCTVMNESGATIENVSVNRKNKKGETFPNFDDIAPGREVEGDLWQSPAGKWYLFAPKAKGQGMGPRPEYAPKPISKSGAVEAANITKKSVETSQMNKERLEEIKQIAINRSSSQTAAVNIVTAFYKDLSEDEIREKIEYWYQDCLTRLTQPF